MPSFAALFLGCVVYGITGDAATRNVIQVTALVLMAFAALRSTDARAAWCVLVVANAAWAIGDFDRFGLNALYLVSYVFARLGLIVLVAHQARLRFRTALALDGVIAGLAAAAVMTGFVSTAFEGTGVRAPATALAGDAMIEIGLVTLSDASSAALGPAGSSGAPSESSRSASPGR